MPRDVNIMAQVWDILPAWIACTAGVKTLSVKKEQARGGSECASAPADGVVAYDGTFEEVGAHLQDNVFITGGYRVNRARPRGELTASQCVESLCCLHNETGNIWSHLLPFLLYAVLCVRFIQAGEWEGRNYFLLYLVSSMICFIFSVVRNEKRARLFCMCHSCR